MLTTTSMDEFKDTAQQIRAHFPKAAAWVKWWTNPLHAVLIFPAFRATLLHQDLRAFAKNPKTTNLCESQHRNYYRYLKKLNLPLVLACINAFQYCTMQVADAEAVATGFRGLSVRDKDAIIRKTPAFARQQEFTGGIRPPVSTADHMLESGKASQVSKRVKPAASGLAAPSASDDHYDMRVEIIKGNLCMLSNTRAHDTHHK
jgi:hypothetical protein